MLLKTIRCAAFIHLFLCVRACCLHAEPVFSISGMVRDSTGARIAGCRVTARMAGSAAAEKQTSEDVLKTETDGEGSFRIEVPLPGSYEVEASATGFTHLEAMAKITPEAPSANVDLVLAVEASTQTVEVTANALAAKTTSTQLGETLETKKIESVPLNGRSFTDLMAVQPGIVPVNTAQPGAVIMTGVATTPPSGDANPGIFPSAGSARRRTAFA